MATRIFVNLPTSDLERSKAFYAALGTTLDPRFTDENAACIVWDENICFMLLTREFFATFTDKPIADPATSLQVSTGFGCASRHDVDRLVEAGLAAGGTEPRPAQDLGFMYSRDLDDPDGNSLGFMYFVPETAENGPDDIVEGLA